MRKQSYHTDDRLLFDRIREGDVKAFEYAFRKFGPRLEAFARKYTPDAGEDIVQDVFLKLWERRELLDNISLASFLFMMVRNGCLNHLKHQQVAESVERRLAETEEAELLYVADFMPDPSAALMQKELSESIDVIMEGLPPKCKEVFTLSRLNGLKNREIATRLDITEKVVEKHITRALRQFREGLRRYALLLGALLSVWKW